MKRFSAAGATALAFFLSAQAWAQTSQVMTITVPYGAGGIVDNTARAYAERLGQELGQRWWSRTKAAPAA